MRPIFITASCLLLLCLSSLAADLSIIWDYPFPADEADRFRIVCTRSNGEVVEKTVSWDHVTQTGLTTTVTLRSGSWTIVAYAINDSLGMSSGPSNYLIKKVPPKPPVNVR